MKLNYESPWFIGAVTLVLTFVVYASLFIPGHVITAEQKITLILEHEGELYSGSVIQRTEVQRRNYWQRTFSLASHNGDYKSSIIGDNPYVEIPGVGFVFSKYSAPVSGEAIVTIDKKRQPNPNTREFLISDRHFPCLIAIEDVNNPSSLIEFTPGARSKVVVEPVEEGVRVTNEVIKLMSWLESIPNNGSTGLVATCTSGRNDYHVSPNELGQRN